MQICLLLLLLLLLCASDACAGDRVEETRERSGTGATQADEEAPSTTACQVQLQGSAELGKSRAAAAGKDWSFAELVGIAGVGTCLATAGHVTITEHDSRAAGNLSSRRGPLEASLCDSYIHGLCLVVGRGKRGPALGGTRSTDWCHQRAGW